MSRTLLALALILSACGEDEPAPIVEPEAPEAPEAPDEPEGEAEAEAEPAEDEDSTTVRVLAFAEGADLRLAELETRQTSLPGGRNDEYYRPNSVPHVTHPDAAWLDDALEQTAVAFYTRVGEGALEDVFNGACTPALAHARIVSLECQGWVLDERGNSNPTYEGQSFVVGDGALEAFDVRDALLPDAGIDEAVRNACRRQLGGNDDRIARDNCLYAPNTLALAIGRDRLWATWLEDSYGGELISLGRAPIPFASLDRKILANTPLGEALQALEGVSVVEVPRPEGGLANAARGGVRVGEPAYRREVLAQWRTLPAELREGVRLSSVNPRESVMVFEDRALADRVAQALSATVEDHEWRGVSAPFVGRVKTPLRLRSSYGYIMPEGAIVVGTEGTVAGRESAYGRRGTMLYASPTPETAGWVAGNLVEAHEGCVPSADTFVNAMPEDRRERARSTLLTTLVELRRGGQRREAVAFTAMTAPANRRNHGSFRVEVHELGEDCALGRRVARHDHEGSPMGQYFPTVNPHGGDQLIALISNRGAWLHVLGEAEPLWSSEHGRLEVPAAGETYRGEYVPLVVDRNGRRTTIRIVDGEVQTEEGR